MSSPDSGVEPQITTLVDSNVLIDVVNEDPEWVEWSANQLVIAADEGLLVINPIIYADISVLYESIESLDDVLGDDYLREPLPYAAGFLAGKAFLQYRRRGGSKRSPLPDFYIGAHAAVAGYRLLTRDGIRYRTYFPTVSLISPDD